MGSSANSAQLPNFPGPQTQRRYETGDANATGEYQTADEQTEMGGPKVEHQAGNPQLEPKKEYAAGSNDADAGPGPAEGNVEPPQPGPQASTGSVSDTKGEADSTYQEAHPPAKFSRMQAELDTLRGQLTQERHARVNAERYSRLSYLRHLHSFDLDGEFQSCQSGEMDDKTFEKYAAVLERHSERLPIFENLNPDTQAALAGAEVPPIIETPGAPGGKERYSKGCSDRALAYCTAKAERGEPVDYTETLRRIRAGEKLD